MSEYIEKNIIVIRKHLKKRKKVISKLNNGIARHTHSTAAGPTSPPLVFGVIEWPKNSINKKLNWYLTI